MGFPSKSVPPGQAIASRSLQEPEIPQKIGLAGTNGRAMLLTMSSRNPSLSPPEGREENRNSGEPTSATSPAQALDAGLYIVATPIGNLRDDTRFARRLLEAHNVRAKLSPYHDHNGAKRRPEILNKLSGGAAIALISDAGTPMISDPGWKLSREALNAGHKVFPVPGASALLAGLVASGMPSDRFMFCGFLPSKSGARKKAAHTFAAVPGTLVFYETGPRLADSLSDLANVLGETRQAAVSRELTKLFEETRRGTLRELASHYQEHGPPKGEIVLLVGPPEKNIISDAEIDAALSEALKEQSVKQAAADIAARFDLPKRDMYQRALSWKDD